METQALLFLKRKKQKNFRYLGALPGVCHRPQEQKFFASFFQKRSAFLSLNAWYPRTA
jgi:hypothetical protein